MNPPQDKNQSPQKQSDDSSSSLAQAHSRVGFNSADTEDNLKKEIEDTIELYKQDNCQCGLIN